MHHWVFEVTLKLSFEPHDFTEYNEEYDEEYDKEDEKYLEKKTSIDATDYTPEQLVQYVKSFDPNEFVEGLSIYEIIPNSAKWLDGDDLKITFRIDCNETEYDVEPGEEKKPVDMNEIIRFITTYFEYESLEDGSYEGFDNGWVVPTADKKFEYGLMDYRRNEIIIVEVCQPS